MHENLMNYAKNILKLDEKSRNFSYLFNRAVKVREDFNRYENKIPKKINKKYGRKQLIVAYTLLKIQKDVIKENKKISMPSILALAIASFCSVRHVQRTIREMIKNKNLFLENFYLINESTGEIKTRSFNDFIYKITNGKLRKIINPFKGLKKYIQAKASERQKMIDETTFKSDLGSRMIYSFYERQKFENISNLEGPPKDIEFKEDH